MSFKANSVIYFRGDVSDKIYILKGYQLLNILFQIITSLVS